MAGHSHWAGIKHRKGRADKQRSKIFSKLSKELTVAAKLGPKDPGANPRLRSAVQAARAVNMPKDNIERAINKSEANKNLNYNSRTIIMIREKQPKTEIVIDLTGPDGNAFALMGYAQQFARQLDLDGNKIINNMKSGDYENLVKVFDDAFGDYVILER